MDTLEIDSKTFACDANTCFDPNVINIIDSDAITYERFFAEYLCRNRPCILRNVSHQWACQNVWIKNGKPDFDFLESKYGNSLVPVANCKDRFFNSQTKCSMRLAEFLSYWKNYIKHDYDENADCFYLKVSARHVGRLLQLGICLIRDWHFPFENPTEAVYSVPKFFASDWINEYLVNGDQMGDDYRFVYMGPKGSWTPLHADVFSSFSWSVNICGKKKWIFLPPGEEEKVEDKFGNLIYDLTSKELADASIYPNYSGKMSKITLIQEIGDAVFVPSGWHHQVWNLDDTISFNHNWVNGCNIMKMWESMIECFESVSREISDCKDMEGWDDQCQLVLRSCFGMDFKDFYRFVASIALKRIDHVRNQSVLRVSGGWGMGPNHLIFDLLKIRSLLERMEKTGALIVDEPEPVDIESLISRITNVIPEYKLV